jgi:hypothetical protein
MTPTNDMTTVSDARLAFVQAIGLRTGKALLDDSKRYTLTDAAFGDAEVDWYKNGEHIATGYFSWPEASVDIFDPRDTLEIAFTFTGEDARMLRRCGIEAGTEENAQEYLDDIRGSYECDGDDDSDEAGLSEEDEDDRDVYGDSDSWGSDYDESSDEDDEPCEEQPDEELLEEFREESLRALVHASLTPWDRLQIFVWKIEHKIATWLSRWKTPRL